MIWSDNMIEIGLGIVVGISFILLISTIYNNKFHFATIKIEKAQEDIDMYLQKKKELLERSRVIVNKETKIKGFLTELDDYNSDINSFDLNDLLKKGYNNLFKVLDENEKLFKSESLMSILNNLNDNEEKIVGAIKFYNDTVVDYNRLVMAFPASVIAFFKRYKKKEFYNNEKREMFEILNEK